VILLLLAVLSNMAGASAEHAKAKLHALFPFLRLQLPILAELLSVRFGSLLGTSGLPWISCHLVMTSGGIPKVLLPRWRRVVAARGTTLAPILSSRSARSISRGQVFTTGARPGVLHLLLLTLTITLPVAGVSVMCHGLVPSQIVNIGVLDHMIVGVCEWTVTFSHL
jgi:hypothetical protein